VTETPLRNRGIRRLCTGVTVGAVVAGVILIGAGFYLLLLPAPDALGALLLAAALILVAMALLGQAVVRALLKAEANINRIHHETFDLLELMRRVEPQIKIISDNSQISDAARSIAHREYEREALRQAIREEMYRGDWEAAHYLIEQMEQRFGYLQEAKTMRGEIAQLRDMTIEEKIGEAIIHIDSLLKDHRWERARQETERLMKLFPRHERVMGLPAELARRREAHKQELLARWQVAVDRNEIDNGIAILTELDAYLTAEEAQKLRDAARHVFKERLLNLSVQFGLAVSENRWRDALEVGLQLRHEFPNSRMAQEVSEKLEILRVRAGFVTDADVVQQRRPQPTT
jgi:hypothetical protein